jgi:hypothetical protein
MTTAQLVELTHAGPRRRLVFHGLWVGGVLLMAVFQLSWGLGLALWVDPASTASFDLLEHMGPFGLQGGVVTLLVVPVVAGAWRGGLAGVGACVLQVLVWSYVLIAMMGANPRTTAPPIYGTILLTCAGLLAYAVYEVIAAAIAHRGS